VSALLEVVDVPAEQSLQFQEVAVAHICNIVAQYLHVQDYNQDRAARFDRLIAGDRPNLTGGIRFVSSSRHCSYVDAHAFRRYLATVRDRLGWTDLAPGLFDQGRRYEDGGRYGCGRRDRHRRLREAEHARLPRGRRRPGPRGTWPAAGTGDLVACLPRQDGWLLEAAGLTPGLLPRIRPLLERLAQPGPRNYLKETT
jgi:hypothetical protein